MLKIDQYDGLIATQGLILTNSDRDNQNKNFDIYI